jgi:hypothetical protein
MSAYGESAAPAVEIPADDYVASDELEVGEPESPMWLPLLGGALLLLAILLFVVSRPDGKTFQELSQQALIEDPPPPEPVAPAAPNPAEGAQQPAQMPRPQGG